MRAFPSRRSFAVASWLAATAFSLAVWAEDGHVVEHPCACDVAVADPASTSVLPPVRHDGPVRYRTGGIGRFEAAAMRDARTHYPLTLTFAARDGEAFQYLSRVTVEIDRADGERMIGTVTDGPMLLAELPPGGYHIIAVDDRGRAQSRDVELRADAREDVRFVWSAR